MKKVGKNLIVGLDIGTSKVVAIVEYHNEGAERAQIPVDNEAGHSKETGHHAPVEARGVRFKR